VVTQHCFDAVVGKTAWYVYAGGPPGSPRLRAASACRPPTRRSRSRTTRPAAAPAAPSTPGRPWT
jgi:hypothetical protein